MKMSSKKLFDRHLDSDAFQYLDLQTNDFPIITLSEMPTQYLS